MNHTLTNAGLDALALTESRVNADSEASMWRLESGCPDPHCQHVKLILADVAASAMLAAWGKAASLILLESERRQMIARREGLMD
jgi:hypothetical protein